VAGVLGSTTGLAATPDWPQFLGPERNGSTSQRWVDTWPAQGPVTRWKLAAGSGFSGPIIAGDTAILFDRDGDQERVRAVRLSDGTPLWEHRAPTAYVDTFGFDNGPRSTPAATADVVVTYGAEGRLTCLKRADGSRRWSVEAGRDLRADRGFFGPACSPLIVGDRVFLNLGNTEGGGIAAFALRDGSLLWKATDHEAGYASPIPAAPIGATGDTTASAPSVWFFTREGLVGASPEGSVQVQFPWRSRQHASVNAASPLVVSNEVFLTSSYDTGAILLRRTATGLQKVWSNDESLSAHYATPVVSAGNVYGFHGRQERGTEFRCVDWKTGTVRWSEPNLPAGSVVLAQDQLVLLLETGEVIVAPAQPEGFKPLGRAQVLGRGTRAPFALSGGLLIARDPRQWICLTVTAKRQDP
jgi:outer membrane protein assembly factor BamB